MSTTVTTSPEFLECLVSDHIVRTVKQTPNNITFEAKSASDAIACVELLQPLSTDKLFVAGTWYVICSLST